MTVLETVFAVFATWTRVGTVWPQPAGTADTRASHRVAVGIILTRAHVATSASVRVDGTRAVTVTAGESILAETRPSPRMASTNI